MNSWSDLSKLTQGQTLSVERVKLQDSGIKIEGSFELPPLAQISYDDQVFVSAFIKTHGSIKEMERIFGVSYPTIKARLNAIADRLGSWGVDISSTTDRVDRKSRPTRSEILEQLERGEITSKEAVELLKK